MKSSSVMPYAAAVLVAAAGGAVAIAEGGAVTKAESPIYGVTVLDGYRQWELVAPSLEGEPLNELRALVGNRAAIDAYRAGSLPFPDGTVLVKLAWKHGQSPEFGQPSFRELQRRFRSWSRIRSDTQPPAAGLRPLHRWQACR